MMLADMAGENAGGDDKLETNLIIEDLASVGAVVAEGKGKEDAFKGFELVDHFSLKGAALFAQAANLWGAGLPFLKGRVIGPASLAFLHFFGKG